MSGSGATCFGLFGSAQAARLAARALKAMKPDWWVRATPLGAG
jgi:4-diphosphocytidyl-2-C-methyl-D-erythritol kinase